MSATARFWRDGNDSMTVAAASGGVRVLVVDDYHPMADLLVGVIRNAGYEARATYSASEALSVAGKFEPHAVVLDVLLPHVDGFELAEEFERQFPACRMLLMSAWDFEHDRAQQPNRYKVVNKAVLMDALLPFLEACRPSEEVGAGEREKANAKPELYTTRGRFE